MSIAIFDNFLTFAEGAIGAKADLPPAIDATEFESALVSYGVVLLHSHMEQCLRSAIETRCSRCADSEVRAFALSVRAEKTGRIKIEALKGTLGRFSEEYKSAFKDGLADSDVGSSWDSVTNQRGTVAHAGQPATCTLADLRLYYEKIRRVLGFFCNGLSLDQAEVSEISNLIVVPAPLPEARPAESLDS